ncbi:MAG: hypothetical protein GY925_01480 [Actinomycetia bacterium]|nr:hypothetical protein [Actinomycetes bacterium]
MGRQVAKGASGTAFVRWVEPRRTKDAPPAGVSDKGTSERKRVPFVFKVFAAEQLVDDPEAGWQPPIVELGGGLDPTQRHRDLDDWIAATRAEISLAGSRAYYVGGETDRISLPPHDAWDLWGDFYATAAHDPLSAPPVSSNRQSRAVGASCGQVGSDRRIRCRTRSWYETSAR